MASRSRLGVDADKPAPKSDAEIQLREMRAAERRQRAEAESQERQESVAHEARRSVAFERRTRDAVTGTLGGTFAGALLGAFAYFLGLAYIKGGTAGAKSWLAAKFVNKPAGTSTSVPLAATKQSTPTSAATAPLTIPSPLGLSTGQAPPTSTALIVPASQGQPSSVLV